MDQYICENIKALRKRHRLTQKEMATQLNIAERSYQLKAPYPKLHTAHNLSMRGKTLRFQLIPLLYSEMYK